MNVERVKAGLINTTYVGVEGRFEIVWLCHKWRIQRKHGMLCEGFPIYANTYEEAIGKVERICQDELNER